MLSFLHAGSYQSGVVATPYPTVRRLTWKIQPLTPTVPVFQTGLLTASTPGECSRGQSPK